MAGTASILENLGPLEQLPLTHVDEAARLAAEAFRESPWYNYIFQDLDENARIEAMVWIFVRNIHLRLGAARCIFHRPASKDPEMVCFFMLQLPGTEPIGMWQMIRVGILKLPILFGMGALRRMLEVMAHADKIARDFREECKAVGDETSFCMLERMVVKPRYQGTGVGSYGLRAGIAEAAARGEGIFLTTQEERNVTFYSRLGFKEICFAPFPFQSGGGGAPRPWESKVTHEMALFPPGSARGQGPLGVRKTAKAAVS